MNLNHATRPHAFLSPSASKRWTECPRSVHFCERLKKTGVINQDSRSPFAEEGTQAHEKAEELLRKILQGEKVQAPNDETDEMYFHAFTYANYIMSIAEELQGLHGEDVNICIEKRVTMDNIAPDCFGSVDCFLYTSSSVHVVDFKYGKGVRVDAKDNTQLLLYLFGAINYIGNKKGQGLYTYTVHIVQPRINNVTRQTYSTEEINEIKEALKAKALQAYTDSGKFKAGEHCKFCPAYAVCPTLKDYAMGVDTSKGAEALTPAEFREILEREVVVSEYFTKVKKHVQERMALGERVEGLKLVAGRGRRVVTDEAEAIRLLELEGFKPQQVTKIKLESISTLERIVGKKELPQILEGLMVFQEGAPVVAFEEDKRPALKMDVIENISELEF